MHPGVRNVAGWAMLDLVKKEPTMEIKLAGVLFALSLLTPATVMAQGIQVGPGGVRVDPGGPRDYDGRGRGYGGRDLDFGGRGRGRRFDRDRDFRAGPPGRGRGCRVITERREDRFGRVVTRQTRVCG